MSLFAAALGLSLSTSVRAEPPATSDADADRRAQARQLYEEGVKAAKLGQWARARTFYLQAWSLQKHWQIAANLGMAEANAGKHRDAAEHLSYFLREAPSVASEDRKKIQALIDQAKAKVGTLTITVNPEGAEVRVDGVPVGTAPLKGEVFVEPGGHVVEARLEGYKPAQATQELRAGGKDSVELQLAKEPPVVPPPTGPTASGGVLMPPPPIATGPRREVLIAGSAAAGTALITGVVFTVLANGKASEAKKQYDSLVVQGGPAACGVAFFEIECNKLTQSLQDKATFSNVAFWSFVGAGAAGAATAIYALVLRTPTKTGLRAVPVVTANGSGFVVSGAWQ